MTRALVSHLQANMECLGQRAEEIGTLLGRRIRQIVDELGGDSVVQRVDFFSFDKLRNGELGGAFFRTADGRNLARLAIELQDGGLCLYLEFSNGRRRPMGSVPLSGWSDA